MLLSIFPHTICCTMTTRIGYQSSGWDPTNGEKRLFSADDLGTVPLLLHVKIAFAFFSSNFTLQICIQLVFKLPKVFLFAYPGTFHIFFLLVSFKFHCITFNLFLQPVNSLLTSSRILTILQLCFELPAFLISILSIHSSY